jgi:hypothetical protein
MKNLTFIPFLLVITLLLQLVLPWWIICIASFAVCYIFKPGKFIAFAGCLLSVFLLWTVKAYLADGNFDTPMSQLLAGLIGNISTGAIFFLTGTIGGLVAGLGGLLGTWTRQLTA